MKTAIILLVLIGAIMAFVRLAPITAESGPGRPEPKDVGDYPSPGGHYAVRPTGAADLAALEAAILATARTRKLAEGVFVTRSLIWGFPDITHIWEEGGNTHVASHLVYGRRDFRANRIRIEAWLSGLS